MRDLATWKITSGRDGEGVRTLVLKGKGLLFLGERSPAQPDFEQEASRTCLPLEIHHGGCVSLQNEVLVGQQYIHWSTECLF